MAIRATASRLADPRSSHARFDGGGCLGRDGEPRQRGPGTDPRQDQSAIAAQVDPGTAGCDAARGVGSRPVIAAGGQPGGLTCRVDAPNLHRHRTEPTDAHHQDDHQRGNRESRLDRDRTSVI